MSLVQNFKRAVHRTAITLTSPDPTPEIVLTCPLTSTIIIIGLKIANVSDSGTTASVAINTGSDSFHLVKNAPIAVGGSLKPNDEDKLVLMAGDVLEVTPTTAGESLEIVISYMEITN